MFFLQEIFHRANINPNKIALKKGDNSITYKELVEKSAGLIKLYGERNIEEGSSVIVLTDEIMEMVPAIIANFSSGRLHVPIDPHTSEERIIQMLRAVNAKTILVGKKFKPLVMNIVQDLNLEIIFISDVKRTSTEILPTFFQLDNPAYVFFTSGSTGQPKAICGNLAGVDHFIQWQKDEFSFTDSVKVSNLTNLGYDASLRDIFLPLFCGGTICTPVSLFTQMGIEAFLHWLKDENVNVLHTVPSVFRALLGEALKKIELHSLSHIFLAGEILHPKDIASWLHLGNPNTKIINLYGPTETVMIKTFHIVRPDDEKRKMLPIGKPLRDVIISLIDSSGEEIQDERIGEIVIHTPFKLLGTFENPQITQEFKTGDYARWIEYPPLLEFLGRKDNLVKINGQRVHLAEIEIFFKELTDLRDFSIISHQEDDRVFIIAFIILEEKAREEDIQKLINERLPSHMRPSFLIKMEDFSRLMSGKIDKKALIRRYEDFKREEGDSVSFVKEIVTSQIVELWRRHLSIKNIKPEDNFFSLGGDSLMSVKMIIELEEIFNKKIGVASFLENPTIYHLKKLLDANGSLQSLVVRLSARDKRPIWFIHPPGGIVTAYSEISQFLADQCTVYAIQDPFYINNHTRFSIEEVATLYADELEKEQKEGSIYLAGWSMGGVICHALAKELISRQREVPWIFMLDSDFPHYENTGLNIINSFFFNLGNGMGLTYDENFPRHLSNKTIYSLMEFQFSLFTGKKISRHELRRLEYLIPLINQCLYQIDEANLKKINRLPFLTILLLPVFIQRWILFKILQRTPFLEPWAKSQEFKNFLTVLNMNISRIMSYKPLPIPSSLYNFKCKKIIPPGSVTGLNLENVTSSELRVMDMDSDHFTLMKGSSGKLIAEEIIKVMEESN